MDNKICRAIKLYPWYWGVGADLLFYVAIDTLFLVTVKHFSEMQILLLTAISTMGESLFASHYYGLLKEWETPQLSEWVRFACSFPLFS